MKIDALWQAKSPPLLGIASLLLVAHPLSSAAALSHGRAMDMR
jgi:hypothetical protein